MLEKEFDRLVKDSLTDHVSDVPGDMWTRVHAQEKRRRALLFWRFTGGGLLLVVLLTGATYFFHHSAPVPVAPGNLSTTSAKTVAATDASPSSAMTSSPASPSAATSSPARPARTTAAASTPAATPATATSPIATSPTAASPTATATSPVAGAHPAHTPDAAASPTSGTTGAAHTTPASSPFNAGIREDRSVATNNTTNLTAATSVPASTERTIAPTHLARIPTSNSAITARSPYTNTAISTAALPKPRPETQQPPHNWQLDLYGSPDYFFSEFRKGLSYTGGVRLTKVFHSGWNVSVGLQYSRFNIKPQLDSAKYTGIHYMKTIDLPILAGYAWGNSWFRFGINAGLIFNLHSWTDQQQSYALSNPSSQYYYSLAPGAPSYGQVHKYQYNVGTSGYLGANLSGYLGHGFSLFAEPYLRQTIFGSNSKVYPGITGVTAAGLSIGLRRQF